MVCDRALGGVAVVINGLVAIASNVESNFVIPVAQMLCFLLWLSLRNVDKEEISLGFMGIVLLLYREAANHQVHSIDSLIRCVTVINLEIIGVIVWLVVLSFLILF